MVRAIQKSVKLHRELLCFCLNILGLLFCKGHHIMHHVCLFSNGSSGIKIIVADIRRAEFLNFYFE